MKGENRILKAGDSENYSWKAQCPYCKADISVVNTEIAPRCKYDVKYGFQTNCPSCASLFEVDIDKIKKRDYDSWDYICLNATMEATQRQKAKMRAEQLMQFEMWQSNDPQVLATLSPEEQEQLRLARARQEEFSNQQ